MHVHVGTDTYGGVKKVGDTAIVTKFEMLQFLPIFPLQSYYVAGASHRRKSGIPSIVGLQSVEVVGLPLACVDRVSLAMAYLRGLFAACAVIGFMSIVPLIMHLTGERLDRFALTLTRGLVASFAVGLVGGAGTYAIPLTPRRESRIRTHCGEALGVSADPARLTWAMVREIEKLVAHSPPSESPDDERTKLIQELVLCRAKIARNDDAPAMERRTDELIERLDWYVRFPSLHAK